MTDRLLAIVLLLFWEAAMLLLARSGDSGWLGIGLSLLVGCNLIVLLASMAEQDATDPNADEALLTFPFPMH